MLNRVHNGRDPERNSYRNTNVWDVPFLAVATYTRLNLAALRLPKSVC